MPKAGIVGRDRRIARDRELLPQPFQAVLHLFQLQTWSTIAAVDVVARHLGVRLVEHVAANGHGGDAGAGHTAIGGLCLLVGPAAILALIGEPIGAGKFPRLGRDVEVDLAGFRHASGLVKGQQRKLAVRPVGVDQFARCGVSPTAPAFGWSVLGLYLGFYQPLDVLVNGVLVVDNMLSPAQGHGLQRNDVSRLVPQIIEVMERFCQVLLLRIHARIEQSQRAKGGHSTLVVGVVRPGPVVTILRIFQIANSLVDGFADVAGGQIGPQNRCRRYNQQCQDQECENLRFHGSNYNRIQ